MQNNGNKLIISYGFGPHTWYRTESESSLPYGGFMSPFAEFEWPWNKVGWKIYSIYNPVSKLNPPSHTTSYIQVCRNLNSFALSFYKLGPRCSKVRDRKINTAGLSSRRAVSSRRVFLQPLGKKRFSQTLAVWNEIERERAHWFKLQHHIFLKSCSLRLEHHTVSWNWADQHSSFLWMEYPILDLNPKEE